MVGLVLRRRPTNLAKEEKDLRAPGNSKGLDFLPDLRSFSKECYVDMNTHCVSEIGQNLREESVARMAGTIRLAKAYV